ncbi:Integrin alpha-9 [Eumeta japonica]|uniref:Integrin alpha-9 n=1 Tax=Eumeta variegata TaxID=151549 RepID=A0A4C1YTQ8_EUMVA|nr:Integrin alpha-9 [Eumeta japonica]
MFNVMTVQLQQICAPLWSDKILGGNRFESQRNGSFGHCYIFSEKFGTKSFSGLLESMKTENDKISSIGGFGWSMLIDERFDRWIIGKPALNGYFFDANLTRVKTQIYQRYPRLSYNIEALTDYGHVGNAFAIGNYFTDLNDTVLAFSATRNLKGTELWSEKERKTESERASETEKNEKGRERQIGIGNRNKIGIGTTMRIRFRIEILFAQFEEKKYRGQKKGQYHILRNMATMYLELQNNAVGSMFGEALCAAELSGDGHDELVVGAPAYSDSVRSADVGAVHIYSSGTLATIGQHRRKFTIVGVQEGGYFGKAIINAGDLDADGFSEICVGAPYEDGGAGAVYVLSGKEVNSLLLEQDTRTIKLNEVKLVQRLRRSSTQAFGFSLLQLPDVDGNGCNELVVAAPRSDSLTLYRCSPSIKVSINLELQKFDNIPENVTSFEIKVCHRITYPTKPKIISNGLYVSNAITGNGVNIINKKEYSIEFRSRESSYCVEVPITVKSSFETPKLEHYAGLLLPMISIYLCKNKSSSLSVRVRGRGLRGNVRIPYSQIVRCTLIDTRQFGVLLLGYLLRYSLAAALAFPLQNAYTK